MTDRDPVYCVADVSGMLCGAPASFIVTRIGVDGGAHVCVDCARIVETMLHVGQFHVDGRPVEPYEITLVRVEGAAS